MLEGVNGWPFLPDKGITRKPPRVPGAGPELQAAETGKLLDKILYAGYSLEKERKQIIFCCGLFGRSFVLRRAKGSFPSFHPSFAFIKISF